MRDDNDSGYKSTCANKETVDETGLPRTRELAYELSARWVRAGEPGLGWIWPGLGHPDLGWPRRPDWRVIGLLRAAWSLRGLGYGGSGAGLVSLGWARRRSCWAKEG